MIVGTQSLGHDWESAALGPYRLDGQPPAQPGQVVLDRAVARQAGIKVGDRVEVAVGGGVSTFQVTGLAGARDEMSRLGTLLLRR